MFNTMFNTVSHDLHLAHQRHDRDLAVAATHRLISRSRASLDGATHGLRRAGRRGLSRS